MKIKIDQVQDSGVVFDLINNERFFMLLQIVHSPTFIPENQFQRQIKEQKVIN